MIKPLFILLTITSFILSLITPTVVYAHQPVMDMAPRWNNGYGIQTRVEHFNTDTTTWLEGVYTFKPAVRMTFKLPYVDHDAGEAVFAVPLKKYTNNGPRTSNWSLTPGVQIPTGSEGEWDGGLSVSYSSETPSYYQMFDVYAWEDRQGVDINVGTVHTDGSGTGWFTLWDISAHNSDSGERILTGPVVMYYQDTMMIRAEYKAQAYDNDTEWDDDYISVGIGFVY